MTPIESLTPAELDQLRGAALGKEVAVHEIERELSNLWAQDDAATRASLMNFAIYNESLGALGDNTLIISEITREHACRALLILCLPGKTAPRVRAWLTAHCRIGADGRKEACSEQVAFLVESRSAALIRNIVFSHLDSDLPLVLWWQGDFTDRFEERLYSSIDRLFVDSATAPDARGFYETLLRALECDRSHFTVHDLAWSRSHPFRLALATAFDDPALLAKLPAARAVSLVCAPGQVPAALLLLAWLATQADWRWGGSDGQAGCFHPGGDRGRTVRAVLAVDPRAAPLAELRIEGEGFSIAAAREPGAGYFRKSIAVDGRERMQMLPAGPDAPAGLVTGQLMRGGNNRLFRKILPAFRQLLEEFPATRGV